MSIMKGPLGLWPFPLVNILKKLVQSIGISQSSTGRITQFRSPSTIVRNQERIVWQDWEGKERVITVERQIE